MVRPHATSGFLEGQRRSAAPRLVTPHAAAFEVYRRALVVGELPETIDRGVVAGRAVQNWQQESSKHPPTADVIHVALVLCFLREGGPDMQVLDFATYESRAQPDTDGDDGPWTLDAGALIARRGWMAIWSYREERRTSPSPASSAREQVVVGLNSSENLWRATGERTVYDRHASGVAPLFVVHWLPVLSGRHQRGAMGLRHYRCGHVNSASTVTGRSASLTDHRRDTSRQDDR